MNVMEPMSVTRRRRRASMNQGLTAADVYPASPVLLAANLATVDTHIVSCFIEPRLAV